MDEYLRDLGETVLERLRVLHATYDDTGMIRDAMTRLFGEPKHCLICAKPLYWKRAIPNDIDPWFCSEHCPICQGDEELADPPPSRARV